MKQRKIKFRSWDKDNKIMTKPFGIMHEEELYSDKDILMQYTGLKDKNGKEIYECDIVENDREVVFEIADWSENWHSLESIKQKLTIVEVIGNIYENPNMLEQKE